MAIVRERVEFGRVLREYLLSYGVRQRSRRRVALAQLLEVAHVAVDVAPDVHVALDFDECIVVEVAGVVVEQITIRRSHTFNRRQHLKRVHVDALLRRHIPRLRGHFEFDGNCRLVVCPVNAIDARAKQVRKLLARPYASRVQLDKALVFLAEHKGAMTGGADFLVFAVVHHGLNIGTGCRIGKPLSFAP